MTVKDLERLYDYGYWANKKLLMAVVQLAPEQFTQTVAGSYGSVRNTLVHTLSAEWGWLDRCGGQARGPALKAEDYPTVESLVEAWTRVEGWVRAFLAGLEDQDVDRIVEYKNPRGETRSMALGEMNFDMIYDADLTSVHFDWTTSSSFSKALALQMRGCLTRLQPAAGRRSMSRRG